MHRNIFRVFVFLTAIFFISQNQFGYAQLSDASREQKELADEQRQEVLKENVAAKPKTAEEVLEMLKERAREKAKTERKRLLLKTRTSAGLNFKFETNPASDALQKGDASAERTFSFDWVPEFNKYFSADLGYYVSDTDYFEQSGFDTAYHSLTGKVSYYPTKSKKLMISPGAGYEWNIYPFDSSSGYEQSKGFVDLNYYLNQYWSYGGKYEYSYKAYDKKVALDSTAADLDYHRDDIRNTADLWIKRQFRKFSIKLKERSYRNNSNDEYQKYNDYDAHHGYITFAGSTLKNGKLYLIYTSDYEIKQYFKRQAVTTARWDRSIQHSLSGYLTLNKRFTLNSSVMYKKANSNDATGVFKNVTTTLGLTANF